MASCISHTKGSLEYSRAINSFNFIVLKCPVKVDANGIAKESDMKRCGASKSCYNSTTINGNPITVGYKDVGAYTNSGSKDLTVSFSFETGVHNKT